MRSLHEVKAWAGGRVRQLNRMFISEIAQRISIKLYIWDLHKNILGEFNFGSYQSNTTPTLNETEVKVYRFPIS
jgi:hypothetical protein